MAVEIVLVTDDTKWQTSFSRVIKEYPDLHDAEEAKPRVARFSGFGLASRERFVRRTAWEGRP